MKIYIPFAPFKWTIHNIIAHPLFELFNLFGLSKIAYFLLLKNKIIPHLLLRCGIIS
jgi:hypothetical protein